METYFKNNIIKNNILSYNYDILQTLKDINNNISLKHRGPYFKGNGIKNKYLSFKNDLYNEIKKLATLSTTFEGILSVSQGGTNITSYSTGDILYASNTTTLSKLSIGSSNTLLYSTGLIPSYTTSSFPTGSITKGDILCATSTNNVDTLSDVVSGNVLLSGGIGNVPSYGKVGLTTHVSGILPSANGGTDNSSYTIGDILYASGATTLSKLADVATGNVLISGGVGLTPSYGKVGLTTHVSGTLPSANGGTDNNTYTIGDILYASGATTLSKLADVATGNVIISGGVGVAPSYGKVGLTTHISGILSSVNGGTNNDTYTIGDILYASGATTLSKLADVATGNVLISGGVGFAPSYGKVDLTSHISGILSVANGGTGQSTYTDGQLLIGNTIGNTLTKTSLTGTSNQIIVTPGSGSITLSTPQDIATSSTPLFTGLTLTNTAGDCNFAMNAITNASDSCVLTITAKADVTLNLIADSDNVTETDNPRINFSIKNGTVTSYISLEAGGGTTMSGSTANALLINNSSTTNLIVLGTLDDSKFTIGNTALTTTTMSSLPLHFETLGQGLSFAEGTNAIMGQVTLVAGSKVVSTTKVTADSRIILTNNASSGTPGFLYVSARVVSTSFTITSSSGADTSNVAWLILEPE